MEKAIACALEYRSECPYCEEENFHPADWGTIECEKCKKVYELEQEVG